MLLNLINDLLDLAKSENLTFSLNKSYFNLTETIKNSFKTLEFLSLHKKVKTKLLVDPLQVRVFEEVLGDEYRF